MSLRRGIRTESTTNIIDDNDSNSFTTRKKKLQKCLRIFVYVDVTLIVVLLVLYIYKSMLHEQEKAAFKEKDATYKASKSEHGVCLPCDFLGPGVKVENTLFHSIKDTKVGGKICCYEEQPYFQLMISRMMDPEITKPTPDTDDDIYEKMKWWRSRKNSIHMYLDLDKLTENELAWSTYGDYLGTSYMNNMLYNSKNNTVELLQAGVYFIYSAITLDFGDISVVDLINHDIKRWHRNLPKTNTTLLISRFGGSSDSQRIYTSFLCGTFKLDNSTNILVEIAEIAFPYIKKSKYASYFGVFMV